MDGPANKGLFRFVPDPFVLAAALSTIVFVPAAIAAGVIDAARAWMDGFFAAPLLAFAFQMCLVLVTGQALASSPPVRRVVERLAGLPKSPGQAVFLVGLVACIAAVVHWGLGAVVGALLARQVSDAAKFQVSKPALGAAAYTGMAVWHGGLSGSAPLSVAQSDHFAAHIAVVPVSETLFSPLNVVVTGGLCLILPITCVLLARRAPLASAAAKEVTPSATSASEENPASLTTRIFGAFGFAAVALAFVKADYALDLNVVNGAFLFAGITAHGSLARYSNAAGDAARGAGAILVQFPFYFGILALLKTSGAIAAATSFIVEIASADTLAPLAFLLAGVTNFLVPSGGGQWAVQGELLLNAASTLGVSPSTIVLAFSYGDAWTNLLQPFWALPLLAIMELRAREIIGYTAVAALVVGVFVTVVLYI